ncbi:hypothetical protein F4861DRAFT_221276 [Xylaria intraflava]|nr:hypothetical protein F4861DRAFT_221276 [Xylaria intraflava]
MIRNAGKTVLRRWHGLLNLPRQSPPTWYRDRYEEELVELREAKGFLAKLSEESDVFFALSRADFDGFHVADPPQFRARHVMVYSYMMAKYTSRLGFYRTLATLCGASNAGVVREVVNASKDSKLKAVAKRHQIDPEKFTSVGRRLRRVWPLLP